MSSRQIWEHEQNDLAEHLFKEALNFLAGIELEVDDSKKINWKFWEDKVPSKRELFNKTVDTIQADRYGAIGRDSIVGSSIDDGIFPEWGKFSVWVTLPENTRISRKVFTPEKYISDIFESVTKIWRERFEREEVNPFDLVVTFYNEVCNYQLRSVTREKLIKELRVYNCDLDDLIDQIDSILLKSRKRLSNIISSGQVMWHTGVFNHPPVLNNTQPLWLTKDKSRNSIYVGQNQSAIKNGLTNKATYTLEAVAVRDIVAADFSGTTFHDLLTINKTPAIHTAHSLAIKHWAEINSVGALVGTNGGDDEVVICSPADDLKYKILIAYNPPAPSAPSSPKPANPTRGYRPSRSDPTDDAPAP